MFRNNTVGFVTMRVITRKDGFSIPCYVFLRGGTVSVLLLVNDKVVVVEQYGVPAQKTRC